MNIQPYARPVQQQLEIYRKEYSRVRAQLQKVGFIFRGSLTQRRLPCGNPNCRCRQRKHWHGPYYQISWKQKGKTVSRFLPARTIPAYREWLANGRTLRAILEKMNRISHHVADVIQAAEATRGQLKKAQKGARKVT